MAERSSTIAENKIEITKQSKAIKIAIGKANSSNSLNIHYAVIAIMFIFGILLSKIAGSIDTSIAEIKNEL